MLLSNVITTTCTNTTSTTPVPNRDPAPLRSVAVPVVIDSPRSLRYPDQPEMYSPSPRSSLSKQLSSSKRLLRRISPVILDYYNNVLEMEFKDDLTDIDRRTEFPAISKFRNMKKLVVVDTSIRIVSDDLCDLTELQELNLRGNLIRELPLMICRLSLLQTIDISRNQLMYIPESIGCLVKLEVLNADSNQIKFLPPSIGDLENLKTLNVANNYIRNLPNELGYLYKLNEFDVSNNRICHLPPSLGLLDHLHLILYCGNQMNNTEVNYNNGNCMVKRQLKEKYEHDQAHMMNGMCST